MAKLPPKIRLLYFLFVFAQLNPQLLTRCSFHLEPTILSVECSKEERRREERERERIIRARAILAERAVISYLARKCNKVSFFALNTNFFDSIGFSFSCILFLAQKVKSFII